MERLTISTCGVPEARFPKPFSIQVGKLQLGSFHISAQAQLWSHCSSDSRPVGFFHALQGLEGDITKLWRTCC